MGHKIPEIKTPLRQKLIELPPEIQGASGLYILGQQIKSIIFSTDIVIIRSNNADSIMAVYPFTPQPVITHAIATAADRPVMMGVGGGTTRGRRVVNLALDAEFQGALAVVLNAPTSNQTLKAVRNTIDIPIIISIVSPLEDVNKRLDAGATILNVSAGPKTPTVVAKIRGQHPDVPIIATGGPTGDTIRATIAAGANAITYTPPRTPDLMKELMDKYRAELS